MTDTAATAATAATSSAPAATEPAPEDTTAAAPALAVGNLVSYTWEDTYIGEGKTQTRYGVVVAVPDPVDGEAPTVSVSWLEGTATLPAELLDTVSGA